jgi:amino acid permease
MIVSVLLLYIPLQMMHELITGVSYWPHIILTLSVCVCVAGFHLCVCALVLDPYQYFGSFA